jgi:hypothetical protein
MAKEDSVSGGMSEAEAMQRAIDLQARQRAKQRKIDRQAELRMKRRIAAQKAAHKTRIFRAVKYTPIPGTARSEEHRITIEADDYKAALTRCEELGYHYGGNVAFIAVEVAYMEDLNRRWPDISGDEKGEMLAELFGG